MIEQPVPVGQTLHSATYGPVREDSDPRGTSPQRPPQDHFSALFSLFRLQLLWSCLPLTRLLQRKQCVQKKTKATATVSGQDLQQRCCRREQSHPPCRFRYRDRAASGARTPCTKWPPSPTMFKPFGRLHPFVVF